MSVLYLRFSLCCDKIGKIAIRIRRYTNDKIKKEEGRAFPM